MKKGTVKFYNPEKKFGFITNEETKQDIFVHSSSCNSPIAEGRKVTNDEGSNNRGPIAINVTLA